MRKPRPRLIGNIFFSKAPLHDGAMILRDGIVYAAGCILPLTDNQQVSRELGTRHRAAVGMSENSDSLVVVVSEETGTVSMAVGGELKRNYTMEALRVALENGMIWDRFALGQGRRNQSKRPVSEVEIQMSGRMSLNRILHNKKFAIFFRLFPLLRYGPRYTP